MDEGATRYWSSAGSRDQYAERVVADVDRVADLARAGDWDTLLDLLGTGAAAVDPEWVNTPRIGSAGGFASLHQAAWHGAGRPVVGKLLALGAWRSMRASDGSRPIDVAEARGHRHLSDLLRPPEPDDPRLPMIEVFLHALVTVRARSFGVDGPLRLPQAGPIRELAPGQGLWCGVPGMYGGFSLRRDGDDVVSKSWCRVVGGSGQEHRITPDEVRLVADGFA